MSFETALNSLSGQVRARAEKLLDAFESGQISQGTFITAMADVVGQARAQGATYAVSVLRDYVETALQAPVAVSPAMPPADLKRLEGAVVTILGSDQDTRMQIVRLATGETLDAAHQAYGESMEKLPMVKGWTRGVDSQACELCQWWGRDGRVFRPDHVMPRHKGCVCHPVPTITRTSNYQNEKQAANAARTNMRREAKRGNTNVA
ncbi:hypothetical protein QYM46_13400 [Brevibacterium sp. K11IcPPYGO002]|uniref:hypothetical protein n=1 Tax=Brevibacterium sp. K11IcPPYGO002 TaxID=3058837 RepID=UPI003D81B37E